MKTRDMRWERTMERITARWLKRVMQSLTSQRRQMYETVYIIHDKIPLFINVNKHDYESSLRYFDLLDSAFLVDGKLVACTHVSQTMPQTIYMPCASNAITQ